MIEPLVKLLKRKFGRCYVSVSRDWDFYANGTSMEQFHLYVKEEKKVLSSVMEIFNTFDELKDFVYDLCEDKTPVKTDEPFDVVKLAESFIMDNKGSV